MKLNRLVRFLRVIFPVTALLMGGAVAVRGQTVVDGFDPNVNGEVFVTVVQTDGKILIGGNFTTVAPNGGPAVSRNYIARLNPDGTLDTAFNPNGSGGLIYFAVFAIAVQTDGKIVVAGDFTGMGGQTRNHIARLDPTTGLADSWDPNAPNSNDFIYSLAVQTDGKILVGGNFSGVNSTIGGQPRNFIARLDPATGLADSFNPSASLTVYSVAVQADGKILVGGTFTDIGGQPRNHIARLDAATGQADSWNPNASDYVQSIAVQADGKILAGGNFSGANSIGGQSRNRIARLDPTTGLADSFDPNANGIVYPIAVQADGKILAGGQFNGANSIGGQPRNRIARLDATTGSADLFDPNANGEVRSIAVQSDGKILVGGQFTVLAPNGGAAVARNGIARVALGTAPAITSANNTTFVVASNGTFTVTATGNPTPTLSESGALPSGVTFTPATGVLSGTPAAGTAGTYPITFTASNGVASDAVQSFTLTVNSEPQAPAITSANITTFTSGIGNTFTVMATGNPTPTLSESGALPSGVTFTPATGALSGTPEAGSEGTYPITFTASNGVGGDAMQSFTLTVIQPSQAPAITSVNSTSFAVGSSNNFTVTATGNPAPTLSESGALPSGVTFTPATGVLGGTPAAGTGGTYPITFTANNGVGSPAMQSFTLTVIQAPTITSANGTSFAIGSSSTFTVTATGNPTPTLSESGALPSGVTFTPATGVLSGTPAAGTIGNYPITFTASNGVGSPAMQSFTLTVGSAPGSALDGFDPNADGPVWVAVTQPDGKILIGGDFTTLSPNGGVAVTRNHIARLNVDGTVDTAFDPKANNTVRAIALQADGKILAGGSFTSIGGATRNNLARLDATTGLADSFDPNANNTVYAFAVQTDGKILAGGSFTSIGGATRNRIGRLNATTGSADSFDPSASDIVYSIVLQADGNILAGGAFISIGGTTRNRIARLDATTGLADSFDPGANNDVLTIALQPGGKILAGGSFTTIGGQPRNYIGRLDATTGSADSFNPSANNTVHSIVVQPDGNILVGGSFNGANSIGGATRNRIARLDPTDGSADSFDPNADSDVLTVAVQQDGKILAGGAFTTLAPNGGASLTRNHIARLEMDGRLDQTLDLGAVGTLVAATAVQPDGKILIGGNFSSVLGVARHNIARLNTDGTLDMAFDPNSQAGVFAIAVQPDGKILVGGEFFLSIGGQTRQYIARLDAVTGAADAWNPSADSPVYSIAMQADGKILAAGGFNNIGGQARRSIARLDAVTGLVDSWNANPNDTVKSIAVQADGKILLGGLFHGANSIGGQTRNYIARLDAVTGLADSWDPNSDGQVESIAIQTDGQILAGGAFQHIGGQPRNFTARLDAVTGMADAFNPGTTSSFNDDFSIGVQADGKVLVSGTFTGIVGGQMRNRIVRLDGVTGLADSFNPNANDTVHSIAVLPDGKILTGGTFTNIGGQARNTFARLTNDTAALENLAVTPTAITWTRGGSSPQFARVTFESSTDNVSYTFLGNGTTSGGNWILAGSFPTNQNFYIRARGYYRSGYGNGSESIAESVRNVSPAPGLKIISISHLPNGHIVLQCLGVPNRVNNLQVSADLRARNFAPISPPPPVADGIGAFTYDDAGAVGLTQRFYRLASP